MPPRSTVAPLVAMSAIFGSFMPCRGDAAPSSTGRGRSFGNSERFVLIVLRRLLTPNVRLTGRLRKVMEAHYVFAVRLTRLLASDSVCLPDGPVMWDSS